MPNRIHPELKLSIRGGNGHSISIPDYLRCSLFRPLGIAHALTMHMAGEVWLEKHCSIG